MAKGSHLSDYLEVNSLSSDQVFLWIQLKTFSKFSGWTFKFFAFELHHSLFHILIMEAAIGLTELFSIFLSILLKFSNWS